MHRLRFKLFRIKSISLLLFLGLIGCLTPIDFSGEVAGGLLVVSGQISTISDQNYVSLGTTADTERLPVPISGASVTLHDDKGNSVGYFEDPLQLGLYKQPGIVGITGTFYHIEIKLPNGKVYHSIPEKMPEPAVLDSTYYKIIEEDIIDEEGTTTTEPFLKVYANSTIPSNSNYFIQWKVEETFKLSPTDFPDPFGVIPPPCFISQNTDPQRVVLLAGEAINTNKIEGQLVASRIIDWSFLEKHYFTTYQSAITNESYEYWRKVNILANQVGSIFDTPPAEITGNIISSNDPSEKIVGFFQASNQTYDRFYVLPKDLPFEILNGKCDYQGDFNGNTLIGFNPSNYPVRCITCIKLRNSSYERPAWF